MDSCDFRLVSCDFLVNRDFPELSRTSESPAAPGIAGYGGEREGEEAEEHARGMKEKAHGTWNMEEKDDGERRGARRGVGDEFGTRLGCEFSRARRVNVGLLSCMKQMRVPKMTGVALSACTVWCGSAAPSQPDHMTYDAFILMVCDKMDTFGKSGSFLGDPFLGMSA